MTLSIGEGQAGTAVNGIAADTRSLDKLRQLASQDPAKAVQQVATQFEALFMQMVLKSMRDATPKSGLLDSSEQQTYTSMLDEQLAQKIAGGGTGLASVIARQLSRNLPHATASATTAPTATGGGPGAPPPPAPAAAPATEGSASVPGSDFVQAIRAARSARLFK